jgi:hypothetical protein
LPLGSHFTVIINTRKKLELELEQINTNPNDTEANAAGRRGVRVCSANGTRESHGVWVAHKPLYLTLIEKKRAPQKVSQTSKLSATITLFKYVH